MSKTEPDALNTQRVKSILKYAVRAPSSHNTQPWRFRISGNSVLLYADRTRALPANDPDDRELTISCGCALMNLRVAATQDGLAVKYKRLQDPDDEDLLAVVELDKSETSSLSDADLFQSIDGRRTYRKRFEPHEVPDSALQELVIAAIEEGAWLTVIEAEQVRKEVAALVSEGNAIQWSNPSWRRELAAWLHPRHRSDGLTVPGLVAPIAQFVVRTFDMGNVIGAKDKQLADESPILAVLGSDGDGVADWLNVGQALEKLLLNAYDKGLQASFLNQPVQVASLRPKLQHLLGRTGFPQILLRLGFPADELPAAPRRNLEEVID